MYTIVLVKWDVNGWNFLRRGWPKVDRLRGGIAAQGESVPSLRLVHGVVNSFIFRARRTIRHAVYEPKARARILLALRFDKGNNRRANTCQTRLISGGSGSWERGRTKGVGSTSRVLQETSTAGALSRSNPANREGF